MQMLINNGGEVRNVQQDSGISNEDAGITRINEYTPKANFINKKLNSLPYSGLSTVFLGYDVDSVRQEICSSTSSVNDIKNGISDLFCNKSTLKETIDFLINSTSAKYTVNKGTTLADIINNTAKNQNTVVKIDSSYLNDALGELAIYPSYGDKYTYTFKYNESDETIDDQNTKLINSGILSAKLTECNSARIIDIFQETSKIKQVVCSADYTFKDYYNWALMQSDTKLYNYSKNENYTKQYVITDVCALEKEYPNEYFNENYINENYKKIIDLKTSNKINIPSATFNLRTKSIYVIEVDTAKKVTAYVGTKTNNSTTYFLVEGLTIKSCMLDDTNEYSTNKGTPWSQDLLNAAAPNYNTVTMNLALSSKAYKSDGTYDTITDLNHVVSSTYSYYEISFTTSNKTYNIYSSPNKVESTKTFNMNSDTLGTIISNITTGNMYAIINDIEANITDGYKSTGKYYAIGNTTGTKFEETDCPTEDVTLYAYTESYVALNNGNAISYSTQTWTPHESSITLTFTTSRNGIINDITMPYIIDNNEAESFKVDGISVSHNYNTNSNNLDIQGFYTHGSSDKIIHVISGILTGIAEDGTKTDYTDAIRYKVKIDNTWTSDKYNMLKTKIIPDGYKYNTAEYFCHDYTRPDYTAYNNGSFENKFKFNILIPYKTTFPIGYKLELKVKYEIATTKAVIS